MFHTSVHRGRAVLRPLSSAPKVGFPLPRRTPPADSSVTLERWLDIWMQRDIEPCRAETTVNCYNNIIDRHIVPAMGKVRLFELTPELIEGYYQWLEEEKHLSPNTVRKHHVLLHTALQSAFRKGVIPSNPIQRVTPPQAVAVKVTYYTPALLGELLRAVEGRPLEIPVRLACFLGLRRSEICGLRWRDIDLDSGRLTIRQVHTTANGRIVEKIPKTADSARTLSIAPLDDLMELLRGLRAAREEEGRPCGPEDFLMLSPHGRPLNPDAMTLALSRFVQSRGLAPINFHGLRHTFASMANDARVPMYQISRAMGHSDPSITQRIYTHLFDQTHGDVLAAVADTIARESLGN